MRATFTLVVLANRTRGKFRSASPTVTKPIETKYRQRLREDMITALIATKSKIKSATNVTESPNKLSLPLPQFQIKCSCAGPIHFCGLYEGEIKAG